MATATVLDGETWESIAQAKGVPLTSLLIANGLDPNASYLPPAAGSTIQLPGDPPPCDVAGGANNTIALGPTGLQALWIRLHDNTPTPMTNVKYKVAYPGAARRGVSADGWVSVLYPKADRGRIEVWWGKNNDYHAVVATSDLSNTGSDTQLFSRLTNLGYNFMPNVVKAFTWYLADYGFYNEIKLGFGPRHYGEPDARAKLDDIFTSSFDASLPDIFGATPKTVRPNTVSPSDDGTLYTVLVPPRSNYEGEVVHSCDPAIFRFENAYAVVVSGASFNPCGHMLMNFGGVAGRYFHKCQLDGNPLLMTEAGYRRYRIEEDPPKDELDRFPVYVPNPQGAMNKLESLMSDKELWLVLPHNCVDFAERVFQAGGAKNPDGSDWGLYSNCPAYANAQDNSTTSDATPAPPPAPPFDGGAVQGNGPVDAGVPGGVGDDYQ